MVPSLSRREFLKLGALSVGATVVRPWRAPLRTGDSLIRIAYETVSVYDAPRLNANQVAYPRRDSLLAVYYPVTPFSGPAWNPLWYRIREGYVHSGHVQAVQIHYNQPLDSLREKGRLCRVSIPYTQPYNYQRQSGWEIENRFLLYYDSHHWVTDIVEGPDGEPWYQITESWEGVRYYAAAAHLSVVPDEELTPLSPELPPGEKRIVVSLATQQLTAFEGDQIVLRTSVSTGVANSGAPGLPTETPTGSFNISSKLPAKYMGDNRLTDNLGDRYLTGVPWTMFFAEGGYAIHGAYWHSNFGAPMSKGCINMRPADAQWLYRWVTPTADPDEWDARGFGTRVIVS